MNRTLSIVDFRTRVLESVNLSLVQFAIEWSGACQIISTIFEEVASAYAGQAGFFTIDVENESTISNEFGVREFPTILFFKSGKVVDHITGLVPKNVMISKIENALSTDLN
jgi:thioredoxin 1